MYNVWWPWDAMGANYSIAQPRENWTHVYYTI
jgi:hypothetical protein